MVVFVAGHNGMVGSSVLQLLKKKGIDVVTADRSDLDLRDEPSVLKFLLKEKVTAVIDAAAVVGGIRANSEHAYSFIIDNLRIQNSLISSSVKAEIRDFIFLGSSCIYPRLAPQPLKEEYLLSGYLEPTNEWYAIAKIAGVKVCEAVRRQFGYNYVSLMPTNMYGPGDNFDLDSSHVLPALLRKVHLAKKQGGPVVVWGTGSPYREFLHVDDCARVICDFLFKPSVDFIYNVGTGVDITIKDLAMLVAEIVGYTGDFIWDSSKPDGTPKKQLDITRISALGWAPKISLREGLAQTYKWFLENEGMIKITRAY